MPTDGFEKAKANSKPLAQFMATPEVSQWLEVEVRGKETRRTYSSSLFRYWNRFLNEKYSSLNSWIEAVRTQRQSDKANIRKTWAIELQRFMDSQNSANGKVMAAPTRKTTLTSRGPSDRRLPFRERNPQDVESRKQVAR